MEHTGGTTIGRYPVKLRLELASYSSEVENFALWLRTATGRSQPRMEYPDCCLRKSYFSHFNLGSISKSWLLILSMLFPETELPA